MKKFIIKSNEWYDDLKEPKRVLFFVVVVMGSLIFAQYLMYAKNFIWAFPIWALTVSSWRVSYSFIRATEDYKKRKRKL